VETARRRLLRTPSTETLFVLTIVLFAGAYVAFMRQEIRA